MMNAVSRTSRVRCHSFSLIEIMVVLLIMGLLAALVAPKALGKVDKAKWQSTQAQVRMLGNACKDFYLDVGRYPRALDDLVTNPGESKWDGPYLDPPKMPTDAWGSEFQYRCPGESGRDFDITSYGKDNAPGGDKWAADINSWE